MNCVSARFGFGDTFDSQAARAAAERSEHDGVDGSRVVDDRLRGHGNSVGPGQAGLPGVRVPMQLLLERRRIRRSALCEDLHDEQLSSDACDLTVQRRNGCVKWLSLLKRQPTQPGRLSVRKAALPGYHPILLLRSSWFS